MNVLEYFATPGAMTCPGSYAALFDCLPSEIDSLCRVVQGLMIHVHWLERYGAQLPRPRLDELQLRSVAAKLARIGELDRRSLRLDIDDAAPPHFSVMPPLRSCVIRESRARHAAALCVISFPSI